METKLFGSLFFLFSSLVILSLCESPPQPGSPHGRRRSTVRRSQLPEQPSSRSSSLEVNVEVEPEVIDANVSINDTFVALPPSSEHDPLFQQDFNAMNIALETYTRGEGNSMFPVVDLNWLSHFLHRRGANLSLTNSSRQVYLASSRLHRPLSYRPLVHQALLINGTFHEFVRVESTSRSRQNPRVDSLVYQGNNTVTNCRRQWRGKRKKIVPKGDTRFRDGHIAALAAWLASGQLYDVFKSNCQHWAQYLWTLISSHAGSLYLTVTDKTLKTLSKRVLTTMRWLLQKSNLGVVANMAKDGSPATLDALMQPCSIAVFSSAPRALAKGPVRPLVQGSPSGSHSVPHSPYSSSPQKVRTSSGGRRRSSTKTRPTRRRPSSDHESRCGQTASTRRRRSSSQPPWPGAPPPQPRAPSTAQRSQDPNANTDNPNKPSSGSRRRPPPADKNTPDKKKKKPWRP